MTEEEKLNRLFSLMVKIKWTNSERYRDGIMALFRECDNTEMFAAIEHVLTRLKYCKSEDLDYAATNIANIITQWDLKPANTLLVGLAEPNKTCGSTALVRAIETKLKRDWEKNIHTNFVSAFRHRDEKQNLIIVDDFIGTGKKLTDLIARLKNNPKTSSYRIFVTAFAGQELGISNVEKAINGSIYTEIPLTRAISDTAPHDESEKLLNSMLALEEKIFQKPGVYSLGYQQSEAAFFLEAANIPNNNFPILWWDKYANNTDRATLFTRR